ncbi:uncharacterized protein LOC106460623 [Limulus polyphemus]|uniref:Uncharacterized protein LOC106460623 n=1 Tax=Limulus polyphemus TaxID=6850 RepID=A0ABM1SHX2_LIMPO|nr:uncharacterized protein LOC106460623 [Limulus polyphemus]XP_022243212.1 uncharacterized protein LOC106460623 [Limulus polyphemus]XP_022243217.1 uncharacterized protein LOC106460623 [Limulus polyphemus]XP_022243227.1 uncharacterized protein LOC106460623 [Limulus polyphemus]XP_022243235.1 uncharacterized protein LOC106460623 [Limulus polyphemus]
MQEENDSFCKAAYKVLSIVEWTGKGDTTLNNFGNVPLQEIKDEKEKSKSLNIIEMLKTCEERESELLKLTTDIHRYRLARGTTDITQSSVLEEKIKMITELTNHLSSIISETDQLRYRLQQPLTTDAVNIHVSHHKSVVEFFYTAVSFLNELEKHLGDILWISRVDWQATLSQQADTQFITQKQWAQIQSAVHAVNLFRSALCGLYKKKVDRSTDATTNIEGSTGVTTNIEGSTDVTAQSKLTDNSELDSDVFLD